MLPDDLRAAGMALYPNGVYINSGLPNPGVTFALASLDANIVAARAFLVRRAELCAAEAARAAALAAKPAKRPRRPRPVPVAAPPALPITIPAQLSYLEAA